MKCSLRIDRILISRDQEKAFGADRMACTVILIMFRGQQVILLDGKPWYEQRRDNRKDEGTNATDQP